MVGTCKLCGGLVYIKDEQLRRSCQCPDDTGVLVSARSKLEGRGGILQRS